MKLAVLSLLLLSSLSFAQDKNEVRLKCQTEYQRIIMQEVRLQVKAQVENLKNREVKALREGLLSRSKNNDILCHSVYRSGQVKRMKKQIRESLNYVVSFQTEAVAIVNSARNRREEKRMQKRLSFNQKKLERAINKY